jgi:O-antigen/teichoic acid export membrane protein
LVETPAESGGDLPSKKLTWIRRGTAALADQGLFAVGNFILNVLLARWLTPEDYGAFSVAFAAFLLLGTLHTSLLTEPMLVFGSGRHSRDFASYMGSLLRIHWKLSVGFSGVLILIALLNAGLGSSPLAASMGAFAVAVPLILLTWLARRAYYVLMRPEHAAIGGTVYLVSMLVLLIVLRSLELISPVSAAFTMGLSSLASLGVLLPGLGIPIREVFGQRANVAIARQHWGYGRWALGTALLSWVPTNLFLLVLPLGDGLEASGAFRALLNLFVPMMHVTSALGILALPALVRFWRTKTGDYAWLVGRLAIGFAAISAGYGILIAVFGRQVLLWLYGGNYIEFAPSIAVLAAVPALAGLSAVFGSALRAVERPELVFRAYVLPTVAAGSVGVLLAYTQGVSGASLGWLLTYASAACSLLIVFLAWSSRPGLARGQRQ